MEVIEDVASYEKALGQINEALKDDEWLILSTPNKKDWVVRFLGLEMLLCVYPTLNPYILSTFRRTQFFASASRLI